MKIHNNKKGSNGKSAFKTSLYHTDSSVTCKLTAYIGILTLLDKYLASALILIQTSPVTIQS